MFVRDFTVIATMMIVLSLSVYERLTYGAANGLLIGLFLGLLPFAVISVGRMSGRVIGYKND